MVGVADCVCVLFASVDEEEIGVAFCNVFAAREDFKLHSKIDCNSEVKVNEEQMKQTNKQTNKQTDCQFATLIGRGATTAAV